MFFIFLFKNKLSYITKFIITILENVFNDSKPWTSDYT